MVIEILLGIVTNLLCNAISCLGVVSLPLDAIKTLQAITCYGSYVVGSDLLLIFTSVISFWFSVKMGVGIILFIWRLLPLT